MSKIRIYQLAKELGVDNKEVINKAIALGMPGKNSHSNSLEDDEAETLRREFIRDAMGARTSPLNVQAPTASKEVTKTIVSKDSGETLIETNRGGVIRRRKRADGETDPASESIPVEAEPKMLDLDDIGEQKIVDSTIEPDSIFKSQKELDVETDPQTEDVGSVDVLINNEELLNEAEQLSVAASSVSAGAPTSALVPALEQEVVIEKKGPRILGKMSLPVKQVPQKSVSSIKPVPKKGVKPAVVRPEDLEDEDEKAKKKKRKQEFTRGDLLDYDVVRPSKKGGRGGRKHGQDSSNDKSSTELTTPKASKRVIRIDEVISVGDLAKAMSLKSGDVIAKLIELGIMATINQRIDIETAQIIAEEFGYQTEQVASEESTLSKENADENPENLRPKPPVVTVMGHVDHGKTTLLDSIRNASVADKEYGGITQHIGAYQVVLSSGKHITFIDTPGHAAFTEMRARGAKVTDIVILVVAADDGVMPQTVEALNHAKAAKVPIIVAVNKIDKPGGNLDRIKQALAEYGLQPEDWGGDTMFAPVSALKKEGIGELLERILLQAEVLELKADPTVRSRGVIIEAKQDRGRGIVATILVQKGTLRVGDTFVAGAEFGRVRTMIDYTGKVVKEAPPAMPVEITGFTSVPLTGDDFFVTDSESQAREITSIRQQKKQLKEQKTLGVGAISLEEFARRANDMALPELNIILKGDVQGSIEAVKTAVESLSGPKVKVRILHAAVGGIIESDVQLAAASDAIIVGFCVRGDPRALAMAESNNVETRFYRVIYELIDDIKKAMAGLLDPIKKESVIGRATVRETFTVPKFGMIAGCYIQDGFVKRGAHLRLLRDNKVVFEGSMSSLRRFKDDVREVQSGFECGIGITSYNDIKVGDVIEAFEIQEIEATLE